ncbi:F0-ATP synthase, b subunit [gamma proteobacterium HdN1]|nr:F0-ATP synthase, b subunit [gamma proteobacterium HdN1]
MNINLTLFGQMIAFALFIWFCMKFIWPPVINAMQERQRKIAEGLQEADRASKDLELAQKSATDTLREAKVQAAQLIEQANKRANQLIEEAKDNARAEGERIKVAAQADIEQEVQRAKEALRAQLASLSLLGAEKILQTSINQEAHSKMLEQLAAEL